MTRRPKPRAERDRRYRATHREQRAEYDRRYRAEGKRAEYDRRYSAEHLDRKSEQTASPLEAEIARRLLAGAHQAMN